MLKVAGSLVTHQVRAYDLLRMFGREGRPTPLGLKHRNLNLLGRYSFTASTWPPAPCARCATRTRPNWTRTTTAGRSEIRSRSDQSVTGRHSASRATTSRQARSACRGW
nr:hypothetical protein [Streptomyces sp. ISID311]